MPDNSLSRGEFWGVIIFIRGIGVDRNSVVLDCCVPHGHAASRFGLSRRNAVGIAGMIGVCLGVTGMLGLTGTLTLCGWTSIEGAIYLSTLLCTIVLTLTLKRHRYGAGDRFDNRSILCSALARVHAIARDL
jgi:hypothetical protein